MKNLLFSLIFLQNFDKTVGKIDCIFCLERWWHGIMVICTETCKDDGGEETSLFNVLWCRVHILIPLYGYAAAYAPMRIIETYRQTNHCGKVKKKGGKKTTFSPPKWYWLCKLDIRILLVFMKSCGWCGSSRNPDRHTLVGFCQSLTEKTGGGFAEKMT